MILTAENLVHLLLERGLLTRDSVVHGGVEIAEISRRNRNFKVMQQGGSGHFVKQVRDWDPESMRTLRTEAECYKLATQDPSFNAIKEIVPRFRLYDQRRSVLITELLEGAETITDQHFRSHEFPIEVAEQLGQVFGAYHREVSAVSAHGRNRLFLQRTPWVFSLHKTQPERAPHLSAGIHQMIAMVRQFPEFGTALEKLRSGWSAEGLIHGDIKWDNCMLYSRPDGQRGLKIVDWELADWGDPCWDVAGIINAYLWFWVESLPGEGLGNPSLAGAGGYPLEHVQPAIRSFWAHYANSRELSREQERELLRRSVMYTAARIIQTAFEALQMSPSANSDTVLFLQLSMNMLNDPDEATRGLLGIEL